MTNKPLPANLARKRGIKAMADKKKPFIKTTSEDTANQLIKLGFELINKSGGQWTFVNKGTEGLRFSDMKSCTTTNILSF